MRLSKKALVCSEKIPPRRMEWSLVICQDAKARRIHNPWIPKARRPTRPTPILLSFPSLIFYPSPDSEFAGMYHTREWARFRHGLIGHLYDILQTSQNSIMMEYSKICSPSLVALFSILNTKARACSINRSAVLSKCEQILSNRRSYTFWTINWAMAGESYRK